MDYTNFFTDMKKFKEKQYNQKQRGLNDYNLLTTVLSVDDEVRLHSRMLHSLLDPDGLHYQGSLFLESFLDIIGLGDKNFFMVEKAIVKLEYKYIDLHITDGKKHIIVENKIHASDQESQIKRYIEKIIGEEISPKDIIVIYLSIDREKPSDYSLGRINQDSEEYFTLDKDKKKLHYKGRQENLKECVIDFKSIQYRKDILKWLERCQYEVQNITNLNEAIRQYKEVIEMLSKVYKSKSTQIKDFLGKENTDNLKISYDIYSRVDKNKLNNDELVKDIINNFYKTVDERYHSVALKIVDEIKEKLGKDISSKIKNVNPIILNGDKRYANNHYIDLVLENEIRIQLMYRNDFKLMQMNVYNSGKDSPSIECKNDFGINNFYELLTKQELIRTLCKKHADNSELINKLKILISEYDKLSKT